MVQHDVVQRLPLEGPMSQGYGIGERTARCPDSGLYKVDATGRDAMRYAEVGWER